MTYKQSAVNGNGEWNWPESKDLDREGIEAILCGLLKSLPGMAAHVWLGAHPAVRRAVGKDELAEEVLIAVWRELESRSETRLRNSQERRDFVFGILRNHAAKAARNGKKYSPLSTDPEDSGRSVLDEVIASQDSRLADQAVCDLEALVEIADKVLSRALARLSPAEAKGVDAWLREAGYIEAGKPHGLSLAKMRRAVRNIGSGFLGYYVSRIRCELEALYQLSPAAAARIQLGRLQRLVIGERRGRRKGRDREAQKLNLVEYQSVLQTMEDHAA